MATTTQLNRKAMQMYGENYDELTPGEKAAVSRAVNKARRTSGSTGSVPAQETTATGGICSFLRFGMNGVKQVPFAEGATLEDAYNQQKGSSGGITIDSDKEGFVDKDTGAVVTWKDTVKDGQILVATVGVSSA
jgi:hypothetical protein